mgnify:FL=1
MDTKIRKQGHPAIIRKLIDRSVLGYAATSLLSLPLLAQPIVEFEPLVVRATPLAAPAFDQAGSMDIIDESILQNAQAQINLSETLLRVPGVVAQNRQNFAQDIQISVRGFGARSTFGVRGLRLYADGIPATMPDGQGQTGLFDLYSAARIEVVRGPFSALYGNAAGGVISVTSEAAPKEPTFSARYALGSFSTRQFGFKAGGISGADMLISATQFDTHGYREHSLAKRRQINAKLKLAINPQANLSLVANVLDQPGSQDPLGLSKLQVSSNPRQADALAVLFNTRKSVSNQQLGFIYEQNWNPENSLRLSTHYGLRKVEQFLAIPVAPQQNPLHAGGVINLDRDFSGWDARWTHQATLYGQPYTWAAGIAVENAKERRRGYQNFTGGNLGVIGKLSRDEDDKVSSVNYYAQIDWQATNMFNVNVGARATRIKFKSQDYYVTAQNPDDSGSANYRDLSPFVGVVYHVNPSTNLYVSRGGGFETPTFNELSYRNDGSSGLNLNLKAVHSVHSELGIKTVLEKKFKLNAALFQIDAKREIVIASNSGGRSVFQNAGSTRRRGAEIAIDYIWLHGFSFYSAATYLHARYQDAFVTCPSVPCVVPVQVPAGNKLPGIPRTSVYTELQWQHPSTGLYAAIEGRYQSRIYVNDLNTEFADAYFLSNIRAGVKQKWRGVQLEEFIRVDNIFNKAYIGSVIVNEANRRYYEPAPGRNYFLGVVAQLNF